jgi:pimeloyl-ACP methyl ester carboxylesterase
MSAKPTVLFVPGAWHTPESFQYVADHLIAAGYDYVGVDKPSVSLGPDYVENMDPDIESVRDAITKASDAGNDVVLVMHSYGGVPGSAGAKGLRKEDRAKEGKKGGVVRLVFVTAFALDEGQTLADISKGSSNNWTELHVSPTFRQFRYID